MNLKMTKFDAIKVITWWKFCFSRRQSKPFLSRYYAKVPSSLMKSAIEILRFHFSLSTNILCKHTDSHSFTLFLSLSVHPAFSILSNLEQAQTQSQSTPFFLCTPLFLLSYFCGWHEQAYTTLVDYNISCSSLDFATVGKDR